MLRSGCVSVKIRVHPWLNFLSGIGQCPSTKQVVERRIGFMGQELPGTDQGSSLFEAGASGLYFLKLPTLEVKLGQ